MGYISLNLISSQTTSLKQFLNISQIETVNQVVYLSPPDQFEMLEQTYLKVREQEQRLYSDEALKELPHVPKDHPHLVEWQIRTAAGEALPWAQDEISIDGHAIECRITSEDVDAGFLPSTGTVRALELPQGPGIRWDGGIAEGFEIGPIPVIDLEVDRVVGDDREEHLVAIDPYATEHAARSDPGHMPELVLHELEERRVDRHQSSSGAGGTMSRASSRRSAGT